ncbi:MAG: tetratricopeptide repeat protein [Bacteroidota bacterium]|nr:tetratricopeptide repeat protein [Bacteroidota bacterium]
MKSLNKLQIGIIAFSVLVFVLLYFANKTPEKKAEDFTSENKGAVSGPGMKVFVDTKISTLPDSLKKIFTALNKQSEANQKDNALLDSLTGFWDRIMQPDVAAFYTEKIAINTNKAESWFKAGDRYYYAVRFVKAPEEIGALYQQAMYCFEKGLKLEPNNVEAKIRYASCFVEGTSDPMKGITMLKEVEKTDSNNVNLQLAFAAFSTKSGQMDKAVVRFEKVLRLKPEYLEAYLYLADAYEQMGDKKKTIETLEKYATLVPDKDAKKEINKYIDKLKSN